MEMIQYQNMVDVFYAAKTLRNAKPNMVESLVGDRNSHKLSKILNFYLVKSEQLCLIHLSTS